MPARGYELYLRVQLDNLDHSFAALIRKMSVEHDYVD